MRINTRGIRNTMKMRTLSGINPSKIPIAIKHNFDLLFYGWIELARDFFPENNDLCDLLSVQKMINKASEYDCVGDFIEDGFLQKNELAAFLLVKVDRFASECLTNTDGWSCMNKHIHDIYECQEYVNLYMDHGRKTHRARMSAKISNENKSKKSNSIKLEWQKSADSIWRDPKKKSYKKIDVARIIQTRNDCGSYTEKYIADSIKRPEK